MKREARHFNGEKFTSFILEEASDLEKPVFVTYAGRNSPLQFYGRVSTINPYEG
ncbi:hypothetical protein ACFO25_00760 [Paenactinomyces guangxiensis]|uniref:Uncharacterized protein n=1 Tax=Paenactinomyces guangxiensis TaxID=1490290 RepID=A0A7W1WSK5_9BACL|nr:hypothetical protein [Paenactinomyces guangxiensis]MBA4495295.1 hypothetical protein [Paenactinomyces guangxiensis]MBH8592583.1 hypothetical protein [Paenactinomyces guangxiensis]